MIQALVRIVRECPLAMMLYGRVAQIVAEETNPKRKSRHDNGRRR